MCCKEVGRTLFQPSRQNKTKTNEVAMKILKAYIFGYDEGVTNKKNLGISKVEKRKVKGKRSVIVIFCIIVLYYEIDN